MCTCVTLTTKLISATMPSENEEQVRLWRHALRERARVCVLGCVRASMGPTLCFEPVTICLCNLIYDTPLEDIPKPYLIFPTLRHSNMVDARIFCFPVHVMHLFPWISCVQYLRYQNPESRIQKEFIHKENPNVLVTANLIKAISRFFLYTKVIFSSYLRLSTQTRPVRSC